MLKGYRRADNSVAIRNHLFVLPAVVCANQVAIDVARRHDRLKFIEHQHGCAQIGADLVQTQRIFSNLAIHPNAYASMFVGLGCEGIIAKSLFGQTKERTQKPMDLVIIQEAGGTLATEQVVESWITKCDTELAQLSQVDVTWGDLQIGLLFDDAAMLASEPVQALLQSLWDEGASLSATADAASYLGRWSVSTQVDHGALADGRLTVMQSGSNPLETATGLTASGAHLLLHFANTPHAFGIPLAPVVRLAVDDSVYERFQGDFDGKLTGQGDIPLVMASLKEIVCGDLSVAEELGMDDFALYRIGPTV